MQFLMALNESYSHIKRQILLMEPLPTINKVYSLLIQEERKRSVGLGNYVHIESTTLAVKGSNVNFNSNFPGFFGNSSVYGGKNSKGKDRPICTHCGKLGHVMEKCFKLHGFPPGFKPKGKNFMVNQVSQCSRSLCKQWSSICYFSFHSRVMSAVFYHVGDSNENFSSQLWWQGNLVQYGQPGSTHGQ